MIFIDDSDVIFESGQEHGLYRYLLTMLDGLESESAGGVCVMMTAMDVGNLPPALVRSGRIELWLEMRLPNRLARLAILEQHLAAAPKPLNEADAKQIVQATDGFTGADLKRTLEDGKALYAYDRVAGDGIQPVTEYYLASRANCSCQQGKICPGRGTSQRQPTFAPVWFNPYSDYDFHDDEVED